VGKALKALLTWYDRAFRRVHDLGALGSLCVALDPSLETLLREVAPLTEFAWRYRYPGDGVDASPTEASGAAALAHATLAAVRSRIAGPSD
jgi:hypothetical protein